MTCAFHSSKTFLMVLAVSLAMSTTSSTSCHAQFTAADWVVTELDFGGGIDPGTEITDITDTGFRYVAETTDRINIAQKLDAPVELLLPGDRVTLQFDVVMNETPLPSGHGGNNFRYVIFDSTQNSDFVNSGSQGGGGGEGFAVFNRVKINGTGATDNGKEQTSGIASQINESLGYLGPDNVNSVSGPRWDGTAMRGNTGSDLNDNAHWLGNDLADLHRMEIVVTKMVDGLYFIENSHTNVTQGTSTGDLFSDRLFDGIWRDSGDNTLSFDGMALTVNESGTAGSKIDFTVSNMSMTKTNVGVPGVDSTGKFHVDFVGRQQINYSNSNCGSCWLAQGTDSDDGLPWAPFIHEGTLDLPFTGFTDPTINYADVFGAGQDVEITADFPKVGIGNFTAPSDFRLAANHIAVSPDSGFTTGTLELDLPAGEYEITTYHYLNVTGETNTADRVIADANGTSSAVGVTALNEDTQLEGDYIDDASVNGEDFLEWQRGLDSTPFGPEQADLVIWQDNYGETLEVPTDTFTVTSDGVNKVVITYTSTGNGDFPINGLAIESMPAAATAAVPEPGTLILVSIVSLASLITRRRSNC